MRFIIDIGGTNTRIGIASNHKIKLIEKFDTEQDLTKEVNKIVEVIKNNKIEGEDIQIGMSMPGPADYSKGQFLSLPNMPQWNNRNIIEEINEHIKADIKTNNDANLMALAHHNYFDNKEGVTQFFTVSTGLGAGLIINNEIYMGASGFAQEIAWAPLAFSKNKGKGLGEGALEYFVSGSGFESQTGKKSKDVLENREEYKEVIENGIDALANCIATSMAMVNPNLIVFDGPIARFNKWFIDEAITRAKTRSVKESFLNVEFKLAELDDDAAMVGASYLF